MGRGRRRAGVRGLRLRSAHARRSPVGAHGRARRVRARARPRRLREHVRLRDRARQADRASAASLRRGHLRPRGRREHDGRDAGRRGALVRVAHRQPLRAPAQRALHALQRQRAEARAFRVHDEPSAGAQRVPQRRVHLEQRRGVPGALRRPAALPRRRHLHPDAAGPAYVGDELRPRPAHVRPRDLEGARRRRQQHHVRPRRRHDARARLGDAGGHLQEGPPPRGRLPRLRGHRPRLQPVLVRA